MADDWNNDPAGDDGFMGGESYPSLKFAAIGDTHEGVVRNIKKKQDVDFDSGTPITWANGDPKWVWLFELEGADGEMGTLWVRGNAVKAIREAATEAGAGSPVGWNLKIQHHALGEKVGKRNPAKLYRAKITPAAARVAVPVAAEDPF